MVFYCHVLLINAFDIENHTKWKIFQSCTPFNFAGGFMPFTLFYRSRLASNKPWRYRPFLQRSFESQVGKVLSYCQRNLWIFIECIIFSNFFYVVIFKSMESHFGFMAKFPKGFLHYYSFLFNSVIDTFSSRSFK